jgi:hypothetical protein
VNIRYFAVKDLIDRGEVKVVYTGTESMIADYFTKALMGRLFMNARNAIMGIPTINDTSPQGCVGKHVHISDEAVVIIDN